jgi:signal transduction histidine kinase
VGVQQVNHQVLVTVSDTGVGIPEDQLDKIFDRFHRVENTEGRSQEGSGIGLAMVRELVKLHQGNIKVSSTPGKGSIFTVSLPVGKNHLPADKISGGSRSGASFKHSVAFVEEALKWLPDEKKLSSANEENNRSAWEMEINKTKPTVLLADDNTDMRQYMQRLLSDQYTVVTASDGEEAFEKAVAHKPELLLTDIMMPRLDGFGLLKKIRNHPEIKNTPVIFLSARAGEEAKVEGLDAGADDYLVKPFSARELVVRVNNHIRINQVRRELTEELEIMVQERTKELKRSNDDLQQFAHVASHDLKEPVRKFRTFINRLKEEYGDQLPPKGQNYIDKMQNASERMSSMITGVLKYSSMNAVEEDITLVDLDEIIKSIESDLEVVIHQKKAVINKDNLPKLEGAYVLLYQLFYNLLNNSLKFSEGRPVIDISSSYVSRNGQQYAKIVVADNGIGFDQGYAERIFDAFTRLNSKDKFEGTGLGLALCKKIVERHSGTIVAEGEPDNGAVFTIELPVVQKGKLI